MSGFRCCSQASSTASGWQAVPPFAETRPCMIGCISCKSCCALHLLITCCTALCIAVLEPTICCLRPFGSMLAIAVRLRLGTKGCNAHARSCCVSKWPPSRSAVTDCSSGLHMLSLIALVLCRQLQLCHQLHTVHYQHQRADRGHADGGCSFSSVVLYGTKGPPDRMG